ncbi:hypothetical protein BS50DRAFT_116614 [Corynespora cassiicola Philippines]|uniref:Uncharacterized protein n=1 Tax=Corynespora cassiicola Philippines TaxID=1448308 RepID=A0A2T2NBF0_CORCC|nr:hypothetical protein BS50DRAFT_116614 [Corynespora cassiicola Philippines]
MAWFPGRTYVLVGSPCILRGCWLAGWLATTRDSRLGQVSPSWCQPWTIAVRTHPPFHASFFFIPMRSLVNELFESLLRKPWEGGWGGRGRPHPLRPDALFPPSERAGLEWGSKMGLRACEWCAWGVKREKGLALVLCWRKLTGTHTHHGRPLFARKRGGQ